MLRTFALFILFASFTATSADIPIENFVKHGDYLNMELSPDGKHISARVRTNGRVVLLFLDAATMKIVGGVNPRGTDEIHSAEWVNNERIVYQFRETVSFSERPVATGELFATGVEGKRSDVLYGYRAGESKTGTRIKKREDTKATPEIISNLVNDEKYVLIVEYPWETEGKFLVDNRKRKSTISRLNIYNGKKRKIETLPYPGAKPFANENGEVRFIRWQTVDNTFEFAYRENDDAEWTTIDNGVLGTSPPNVTLIATTHS